MLGNQYRCSCGGNLIPVKIAVEENGRMLGVVCYKQWCDKCKNPRMNDDGRTMYYRIRTDNRYTFEPLDFWCPPEIPFQHKMKFINSVLKLAEDHRFEGKQVFTMEQVRKAFREEMSGKDYSTYGGEK